MKNLIIFLLIAALAYIAWIWFQKYQYKKETQNQQNTGYQEGANVTIGAISDTGFLETLTDLNNSLANLNP